MGNFSELYSQCYDLLYADKDYAMEVDYIHSLIGKFAPSAKTVLDLGCGTGSHDFMLKDKGYTIHGVDLSEGMINIAKKRSKAMMLNTGISFSQGDIRNVRLNKKFDVVISLFHVMSYQTKDEDLSRAFQTAVDHLEPGGLFVFDCWYGPAVIANPPFEKLKVADNELLSLERTTKPVMKLMDKVVDVHFNIKAKSKLDAHQEEFNELHSMRYLFNDDIDKLCHQFKLSKTASFKWLTFENPSEKSWYAIFVLRKN